MRVELYAMGFVHKDAPRLRFAILIMAFRCAEARANVNGMVIADFFLFLLGLVRKCLILPEKGN